MSTTGVSTPGSNYYNGCQLQMFGGETCHVHVKVDHEGHGNNRQQEAMERTLRCRDY